WWSDGGQMVVRWWSEVLPCLIEHNMDHKKRLFYGITFVIESPLEELTNVDCLQKENTILRYVL
ncbi:MAG: hypothetical protein H0X50_06380, partial [Nitrosopumilus sp.]|nr:hypothetical protein [Nitrosopumilus sp.]